MTTAFQPSCYVQLKMFTAKTIGRLKRHNGCCCSEMTSGDGNTFICSSNKANKMQSRVTFSTSSRKVNKPFLIVLMEIFCIKPVSRKNHPAEKPGALTKKSADVTTSQLVGNYPTLTHYILFAAAAERVKEMSISNHESGKSTKSRHSPTSSAQIATHHGSCDEYGCGSDCSPLRGGLDEREPAGVCRRLGCRWSAFRTTGRGTVHNCPMRTNRGPDLCVADVRSSTV